MERAHGFFGQASECEKVHWWLAFETLAASHAEQSFKEDKPRGGGGGGLVKVLYDLSQPALPSSWFACSVCVCVYFLACNRANVVVRLPLT